jgi:hypothetical protein
VPTPGGRCRRRSSTRPVRQKPAPPVIGVG